MVNLELETSKCLWCDEKGPLSEMTEIIRASKFPKIAPRTRGNEEYLQKRDCLNRAAV